MVLQVLLAFHGIGCALALIPDENYNFIKFQSDFSKVYTDRSMRQHLFGIELSTVLSHNRKNSTWRAGINYMSDWTAAEKQSLRGYDRHTGPRLSM